MAFADPQYSRAKRAELQVMARFAALAAFDTEAGNSKSFFFPVEGKNQQDHFTEENNGNKANRVDFQDSGDRAYTPTEIANACDENGGVHPRSAVAAHRDEYAHSSVRERVNTAADDEPLDAVSDKPLDGANKRITGVDLFKTESSRLRLSSLLCYSSENIKKNVLQAGSPTPTPPVQEKRRYGTWMLITKKSKPGDAVRNSQQSRKETNITTASRSNQFGILADVQEYGEPFATPNPQVPSPPLQPVAATVLPKSSHFPNQNSRGRGGRIGTTRGKGIGFGRDYSVGYDNYGLDPPTVGWNSQSNSQNIFQFGGAHASAGKVAARPNAVKPNSLNLSSVIWSRISLISSESHPLSLGNSGISSVSEIVLALEDWVGASMPGDGN
nr:LINE-type retrotransposon LIb DNA [Ipomoea batatas]